MVTGGAGGELEAGAPHRCELGREPVRVGGEDEEHDCDDLPRVRQVDPAAVDAARGMGMSEFEIIRKVELPLAISTVMGGIRGAAIVIVATATIAPLAGVVTLGDYIINESIYGTNGVLAGAILVALLALTLEFSLAGLQRLLTSKGLRLRTT